MPISSFLVPIRPRPSFEIGSGCGLHQEACTPHTPKPPNPADGQEPVKCTHQASTSLEEAGAFIHLRPSAASPAPPAGRILPDDLWGAPFPGSPPHSPLPGYSDSNPGPSPAAHRSLRLISAETAPPIGRLKRSHSLAASLQLHVTIGPFAVTEALILVPGSFPFNHDWSMLRSVRDWLTRGGRRRGSGWPSQAGWRMWSSCYGAISIAHSSGRPKSGFQT